MNTHKREQQATAANERFHASGGADSSDTEQVTTSFALVRTSPMPPPAPSCDHVVGNAGTAQRDTD